MSSATAVRAALPANGDPGLLLVVEFEPAPLCRAAISAAKALAPGGRAELDRELVRAKVAFSKDAALRGDMLSWPVGFAIEVLASGRLAFAVKGRQGHAQMSSEPISPRDLLRIAARPRGGR